MLLNIRASGDNAAPEGALLINPLTRKDFNQSHNFLQGKVMKL